MTEMIHQIHTAPPALMEAEERQTRILDADYSAVDVNHLIKELDHLNDEEKEKLKNTLETYPKLFKGGLGTLKVKPVKFELLPNSVPFHARPFPIPVSQERTTKREINRLKSIGVLEKNSNSEWAAPTFIQPKKTGDVRILTDFRRLNKCIRRKPHPLPKISDLL